jgi:hypothetical protein
VTSARRPERDGIVDERDGTLILRPAVVMSETRAHLLERCGVWLHAGYHADVQMLL